MPPHRASIRQKIVPGEQVLPGEQPAEALVAAFQPAVDLQTGEVAGFEALARLVIGNTVVFPDRFIPHLALPDLLRLFDRMVGHSIDLLAATPQLGAGAYVSVNIEVALLMSDGFVPALSRLLRRRGYRGGLVLEILEGQRIEDVDAMHAVLSHIRDEGVGLALDDIGSAYASLSWLRDLPVDIIKLDRAFATRLDEHPDDLTFMSSITSLARGLGKKLVVEGVETLAAVDALTILGVGTVQGYAVAKPMPARQVAPWLAQRSAGGTYRVPRTMLGVFASHLMVVETCRSLATQPLEIEWKESAKDWRGCGIGRYFSEHGLHATCCGQAHVRFHEVLDLYVEDRPRWEAAASDFKAELIKAIQHPDQLRTVGDGGPALEVERRRA